MLSLRGAGTYATTEGGASVAPGLPAGWQPGDIHILLAVSSREDLIPLPAGWTAIAHEPEAEAETSILLAWRRAEVEDAAPVIANAGTEALAARIAGYAGALATGTPFEAIGLPIGDNPITVDGVTTSSACMIILAAFSDNDVPIASWPGTDPVLTEVFDSQFNATTAKDSTIALASGLQDEPGSTGDREAVQETEATSGDGYLLALMPAGAVWEGKSLAQFVEQEKEEGRISEVADPQLRCPGTTHQTTFRFETRVGDFLSEEEETANPPTTRAEIYTGYIDAPAPFATDQDVTRWYRWQTRFGPDYDVADAEGFRTVFQFKDTADGSALADGYTLGRELRWESLFGAKIANAVPGLWYDFELEAVWSHDPDLALQRLYLWRKQVGELHVPLPLDTGIYLKWGFYKAASVPAGSIYHGGIVCAETREQLGPVWTPPKVKVGVDFRAASHSVKLGADFSEVLS